MPRLEIPEKFNRNSPRVKQIGPEKTGKVLLDLVCTRLGIADLSATDVLDVGCGVRFTQTILNLGVPIRSYTGVDVDRPLIDFLKDAVRDPRFAFAHWDVHNPMYNKRAPRMTRDSRLPVDGAYDLIWLFSVFTHLLPEDSDSMLHILRRHARPLGRLFFSCYADESVARFEDKDPKQPGLHAHYNPAFLRELLAKNGWAVESFHAGDPVNLFIQDHFVCRPA